MSTWEQHLADVASTPDGAAMLAEIQPSIDVSLLLVKLRLDLGLSQREFARRAGVSPSYISQLESGTANPSVRRLDTILRSVGSRLVMKAATEEAAPAKRKRRAS